MKNILLIGVGGTGSNAVDIFYEKYNELGNQVGNNVTALVFDTDAGDLKRIKHATTVVMADNASVGTICDRLGTDVLRPWFPCDSKAVRAQEMIRGASQWRKKSYLAFLNLMNKPAQRSRFIKALESMTLDPSASCEVYVIASVAGGTGSGSFIPIALYAKRYLRKTLGKDPIVNAMIALPDIYADSQTPENRVKVYANAYAILRELNAINLVSRNYNEGATAHKKAPIRFHIGDAKDPNVGLLFDASDRRYWTPEAAPFSQIFLLDRIPGLNSVQAHDIVLANSLYTMICTEIGAKFDSEFSNHELLRSQNNGGNAIYAGVSTGQIRYPKASVLEYLSYKKTVDSCNTEWLVLHDAVEVAIKEKEAEAKACKRRYTMKDDAYAQLLLKTLDGLENAENDAILSILDRCVYKYDQEGKRIDEDPAKKFINMVDSYIVSEKITDPEGIKNDIDSKVEALLEEKGKTAQESLVATAMEVQQTLLSYYQECVENIKCFSGSTADEILTLDKTKDGYVSKKYSLISNLLERSDKYIHPVAAMIMLCRARVALQEKIKPVQNVNEWKTLRQRNVDEIPSEFLRLKNASVRKSAYADLKEERFTKLQQAEASEKYINAKSNAAADINLFGTDAKYILEEIASGARAQMRRRVYLAVAKDLDILINKYRSFFNRFEKEKEDLIEHQKTALRRDVGIVDSVINVFSSEDDKNRIYKMIEEESGPATEAELVTTDDIVGRSVYTNVFNAASATAFDDASFNENDSAAYTSLFQSMVESYRDFLKNNEAYKKIAACNVIEAMEMADPKNALELFRNSFSVALEFATPSIKLDPNVAAEADIVTPSNITVFMMSEGTAKYIKKKAEEFGLHLPADQTKEKNVISSCAEQFIKAYSGNNSARVSIVNSMPDQVLYCTGEVMDVSPLRVAKFNELGEDNLYYRNYTKAIENLYTYETDMWNPHLGYNLHKRGYLPYMNEEKEKECDTKVAKALLFALSSGKVIYANSCGAREAFFFRRHNGAKINVPSYENEDEKEPITNKNIAMLFTWLRNEDKLVEAWSREFDLDIDAQLQGLPSLASDNEIPRLEAALTKTKFMRSLTEMLYEDSSVKNTRVKYEGSPAAESAKGPTAIEFAYMIKTTEELGRDCDDAERILDVIYDTFFKMCEFRASGEELNDRFIKVYTQQLYKIYTSIAGSTAIYKTGTNAAENFKVFVDWLNNAGVFKDVARVAAIDGYGKVRITQNFNYTEVNDDNNNVRTVLKYITENAKAGK